MDSTLLSWQVAVKEKSAAPSTEETTIFPLPFLSSVAFCAQSKQLDPMVSVAPSAAAEQGLVVGFSGLVISSPTLTSEQAVPLNIMGQDPSAQLKLVLASPRLSLQSSSTLPQNPFLPFPPFLASDRLSPRKRTTQIARVELNFIF